MTKKKRKGKTQKPRNFVAKNLFEFNKPKREEDKRKKDAKHKARSVEPFSFC